MKEANLWILHILGGILVFIFLGIHMGVMHLESILHVFGLGYQEPLSWSSVLTRNKQLFFTISYIILLGAALYHGLYGLRNIILELNPATSLKKAINWLIFIGGVVLFVYGSYAAISAYNA